MRIRLFVVITLIWATCPIPAFADEKCGKGSGSNQQTLPFSGLGKGGGDLIGGVRDSEMDTILLEQVAKEFRFPLNLDSSLDDEPRRCSDIPVS